MRAHRPSASIEGELVIAQLGIAVRGGRALHVKHSAARVRQARRYVCSCSLAGHFVEIRTDSPAILESGDRLLVAGRVAGGVLRSYVAANLEHGVTYQRERPRTLFALGVGFSVMGWLTITTALSDARWASNSPLWWTVFPIALAALLFIGCQVAGLYLFYLARAIRRATELVNDSDLRARTGAANAREVS